MTTDKDGTNAGLVKALRKELWDARRIISATHKNPVVHTNCEVHNCPICDGGLFQCADCGAAEAETETRVCSAALQAPQEAGVSVKALEWRDERNCECSAETPVGMYEVGFDDGWWAHLEGGVKWDWQPELDPRSYCGPEAAKAAAQADFETRIRSAIITHPADRDGVEARTIDEWHEDDGDVCWWALDENGQWLGEPAYIGSPLDLGRAYSLTIGEHEFVATLGGWPGYHTHWTPHPAFPTPPASATKGGA